MAVQRNACPERSRRIEGSTPRPTDTAPVLMPVIVLLLSMGACATIPPDGPTPMGVAQCNAEGARWALGREPGSDVVERARAESGSTTVRVIRPGEAVDTDFRGNRLNLTVNARNAIDGVKCG